MSNEERIFLGENGVTSTSANHIANMAKELNLEVDSMIKGLSFIDEHVLDASESAKDVILKSGCSEEKLNELMKKLDETCEKMAIIAWLREGIAAKNKLLRNIESFSFNDYLNMKGISVQMPPIPSQKETYDFYDETEKLNELQWNSYASVYGKIVHPDGAFSEARKEMYSAIQSPNDLKEISGNVYVVKKETTVPCETVEKMFFACQDKNREYNKKINSLRYSKEEAAKNEYNERYSEYTLEASKMRELHNTLMEEYLAYIKEEKSRISKLKIKIPSRFKDNELFKSL